MVRRFLARHPLDLNIPAGARRRASGRAVQLLEAPVAQERRHHQHRHLQGVEEVVVSWSLQHHPAAASRARLRKRQKVARSKVAAGAVVVN